MKNFCEDQHSSDMTTHERFFQDLCGDGNFLSLAISVSWKFPRKRKSTLVQVKWSRHVMVMVRPHVTWLTMMENFQEEVGYTVDAFFMGIFLFQKWKVDHVLPFQEGSQSSHRSNDLVTTRRNATRRQEWEEEGRDRCSVLEALGSFQKRILSRNRNSIRLYDQGR